MSKRKSVYKHVSGRSDSMASNVFSLKDMHSQHNSLNGEFLLYQVVLKRLLAEGFTDPWSKSKLSDYFKPDDETDRRLIKEFDKTYKANKAIYWYTRESCIYRLLNKALRTQNIADLIAFRQFIRDLFDQLAYEQISFFVSCPSKRMKVYRGQLISKDEVNRIKCAKGQLISMNSFVSTSTNRDKAIDFATSKPPPSDTLTVILLEINLNLEEWSRPYADIKNISAFAEEDEILLMFGCVFRIDEIWEDKEMKIWRAELTLCGEKDSDMTEFEEVLEKELEGKDMLVALGSYMLQMEKYDEAGTHYEMLLDNELIRNSFDLATCYHGLAQVNEKKGEYEDAIENIGLALDYLFKNPKTKRHPLVPQCYNDLGLIYSCQGNHSLAYQSYEKALQIQTNDFSLTYSGLAKLHCVTKNYQIALEYQFKSLEKLPKDSSSRMAHDMVEIGKIYTAMNQYEQALRTFERTIRYQEKALSAEHPDLGYTYIAMALMYLEFGQTAKALDCVNRALKIQVISLPNDHSDFRETYTAFAAIYKKKGDFDRALYYYDRLLENQLKKLSTKHPGVTETYSLIGNLHLERKNYDQALIYFHKMLESQLARIPVGNPNLTKTYQMIGDSYLQKNDLEKGSVYFHRLLDNELHRKLLEDPSLVKTYKTMADIYLEKQDLSQALIYFNRLIDIRLRMKPIDEKGIKDTYDLIGDIYLKNCSVDRTLLSFDKLPVDESQVEQSTNTVLPRSFRVIEETHFEKRHLDQVVTYFSQLAENQLKELSPGDPLLSNTYQILGNIHLQKQSFNHALNSFNQLLNNQLQRKPPEDPSLNRIYRVLADLYFKIQNFDQSIMFFHKLLKNLLNENPVNYSSLTNVYQMIARNHLEKNEFLQALVYLNQIFDCQTFIEQKSLHETFTIFGKVFLKKNPFQPTDPQSSTPKSFQMNTITGKNNKEQRHFDQARKYFEELLNPTDENTPSDDSYEIIGKIFLERKHFDQSLIYFHKLLNHRSQSVPSNDPSLITIYKLLAVIYYEKKNFSQALIYFDKLLNIHLETKLVEDPFLADIYQIIAMTYLEKQRFSKALTNFYRSVDCRMQNKPIDQKGITQIYAFVAKIYLKNQHFDRTLFFSSSKHSDRNRSRNSSMDSSSLSSSTSTKTIESIHFEKRHLDQTLNYFHQLLERQLGKLSFGDPLLTDTYQIIANIYFEKQLFDQALFHFNKLLINELRKKALDDFSLTYPYQMIGFIYFLQENYERSSIFFYLSILCQLQKYPIEHPAIVDTYVIIGKIFSQKHLFHPLNGKSHQTASSFSKQISVQKFLLETFQRVRNTHSENYFRDQTLAYFHKLANEQQMKYQSTNGKLPTGENEFILASIYLDKSDYDQALFYLSKSLNHQIRKNPFGDALLADTYMIIANVYFQRNQFPQALKDYRTALSIYSKGYPATHPKVKKVKQYISEILLPTQVE